MSSATSISTDSRDDGFRPWHFFVLASLMTATVAVVMARQGTPEHLVLISATIAAAGVAAAALYRTLAPLTGEGVTSFSQPLTDRTRAALEREKTLALRAIKELEFDRSMGKLSDADFNEMGGRLRARAISLIKQLDAAQSGESSYRQRIERELAVRLVGQSRAGAAAVPAPRAFPACASCGTANDVDAAFCKRCGKRLRPERGDGVEPAAGRPPSESERGWGPASTN